MVRRRRDGKQSDDRATLAPGMLAVPSVRLVRKLAEGGMGSVWEAEHLSLRTNVAVKFVLDELGENAEAAARFNREATAAARIKSPHVVQILDHGVTSEGVAYIVMELLEGEDLESRLGREPKLPLELVTHIVGQSAKALEKAHGLGIVHRDIKPSNVFLTDVGGEIFVKILDFGIAKLSLADVAQMRVTQTGSMIGTPVFMAPEQMTQAKDVGPPADMWSLGVVAYVALTGQLPYDSDTVAGLAMAIERGVFPMPSTLASGLPATLDGWFERALSKDSKGRFSSIREMADAMAKVAGTHVPPSAALQTVKTTSTPPPATITPKSEDAASAPTKPASAQTADVPGVPVALAPTMQGSPELAARGSPMGPATVMGASSAKARQEVRSSTRTLAVAGIAIGALGASAVLYGVLRSHDEPPSTAAATQSSSAPSASASADAKRKSPSTNSTTDRALLPAASETATSLTAPPIEPEEPPTATASQTATGAPPKLTGTLPSGARQRPTATTTGTAPVRLTASATPRPSGTVTPTAAPTSRPSAAPTAVPTARPTASASAAAPPKAPPPK